MLKAEALLCHISWGTFQQISLGISGGKACQAAILYAQNYELIIITSPQGAHQPVIMCSQLLHREMVPSDLVIFSHNCSPSLLCFQSETMTTRWTLWMDLPWKLQTGGDCGCLVQVGEANVLHMNVPKLSTKRNLDSPREACSDLRMWEPFRCELSDRRLPLATSVRSSLAATPPTFLFLPSPLSPSFSFAVFAHGNNIVTNVWSNVYQEPIAHAVAGMNASKTGS